MPIIVVSDSFFEDGFGKWTVFLSRAYPLNHNEGDVDFNGEIFIRDC
jgi:hypothetical protein